MRIYTRTGDRGETGLYGGSRTRKDNARIVALGEVDEANAALGVARAVLGASADLDPLLEGLQHRLFDLGADLAAPGAQGRIGQSHVDRLETAIDRLEQDLAPLRAFILPGGTAAAAALHLARAVVRRAERALVAVPDANPVALAYLNRASDLLFVAARHANRAEGDVLWTPEPSP